MSDNWIQLGWLKWGGRGEEGKKENVFGWPLGKARKGGRDETSFGKMRDLYEARRSGVPLSTSTSMFLHIRVCASCQEEAVRGLRREQGGSESRSRHGNAKILGKPRTTTTTTTTRMGVDALFWF